MPPAKKTAPQKPLTDAEKHQTVAAINARHQRNELSAEEAQAQIDLIREGEVIERDEEPQTEPSAPTPPTDK